MVSFSILRSFGPSRVTAMLRAGAAPWVLLERHCRRHRGKEAARDVFARTAELRKAKKIDARIYEGHAVVESRANNDKLAARRVFELGLDQRP